MNIRSIVLSSSLLLSLPLFAKAKEDVVIMKNGDHFTCEIKGLSGGLLGVSTDYIDGTIYLQWSEVAHLDSKGLFLVKTESGVVYTGKVSTTGETKDPPIKIEVAETPGEEVEIPQGKIINLTQTAEGFWHRFDGAINTGSIYAKGNESYQYNISSQVAYNRERWSGQGSFNSSFSTSSGANLATRNQIDLSSMRLLRWNNWFYGGSGGFLQSSVQQISLQTTVGGGVGRYLKNTSRTSITVLGGFGWQNVRYQPNANLATQNIAVGFVTSEVKFFKFKKTNLDVSASLIPAITDPGRVHFNTNATYYIKIIGDLSWNLSFYGSWDSRPPATLPKSDYGSSSGLSWTFGNR